MATPSSSYFELVNLYKKMHVEGERFLRIDAAATFTGESLLPHAGRIRALIAAFGAATILDYGSGKGRQYSCPVVDDRSGIEYAGIQHYWEVEVTCFDPAYDAFSSLPAGPFDAVVCTDVLEHCGEEDIDWILEQIFSRAKMVVYANVASYPATKRLPDGRNAHVTIKPPEWWRERFEYAASGREVSFLVTVTTRGTDGGIEEEQFQSGIRKLSHPDVAFRFQHTAQKPPRKSVAKKFRKKIRKQLGQLSCASRDRLGKLLRSA